MDIQRMALTQFGTADEIDAALDEVKAYVKNTAVSQAAFPIDNIFKHVLPKSIFVPHNAKSSEVAVMCNYKFDAEHGIAVIFENGNSRRSEHRILFCKVFPSMTAPSFTGAVAYFA